MSDTMRDRMARALYERLPGRSWARLCELAAAEDGALYAMTRDEALAMVDAILSVLESPTRGMYQAAFDDLVPAADAEACWRAMIAAIKAGA